MSVTSEFEKTKAWLKTVQHANGQSLYDHLTGVLLHMTTQKPENSYESFEEISYKVKMQNLQQQIYKELAPSDAEEAKAQMSNVMAAIDRIYALAKAKNEEDEDQETVVPDLLANAELFEWAGINMGKEETYKVSLSITELVKEQNEKETPIKSVRLWGKIFGLKADYIIVEAQFQDWPAEEEVVQEGFNMEAPGEGANEYVYFATNSPEGKWTQLPYVTPAQIQTSKKMRRFFTGDLKAPVLGFPRFPWGEAAYLRAQIARITASTVVSPAGFYINDEEEDDENAIIEDPEYTPMAPRELKDLTSWKHHRKYLLNKQGRVTAFVPPEQEDDEEIEDKQDDDEEEEEAPARLTAIEEDIAAGKKAWSLRISPNKANPHAVVSAHSLNWPGAVSVAKRNLWANIYIGYGHKFLPDLFTPPAPPAVQVEFVAEYDPEEGEDPLKEQEDPQPKVIKEEKQGDEEEDEEEDDEE